MNTILNNIKLDGNYRIIPCSQVEKDDYGIYEDDLDRKLEKIMELKESGKINKEIAERLLKFYLFKYLKSEIKASLETLLQNKKTNQKSKLLFLRWINKTLYA